MQLSLLLLIFRNSISIERRPQSEIPEKYNCSSNWEVVKYTLNVKKKMNSENSLRLAIDIGGTFTDLVLETPGKEYVSHKLLTNHDNPELSILAGIDIVLKKSKRSPIRNRWYRLA